MRNSLACSQSYSRWRHAVFQQLFNDVRDHAPAGLPFLYPKAQCRRSTSSGPLNDAAPKEGNHTHEYWQPISGTPSSQDRSQHTTGTRPRSSAEKSNSVLEFASKPSIPLPPRAVARKVEGRLIRKLPLKEEDGLPRIRFRESSAQHEEEHEDHEVEYEPITGVHRLHGLTAKLESIGDSMKTKPDAPHANDVYPLPVSPLEKIINTKRAVIHKDNNHVRVKPDAGRRPATKEENASLANNIWAELLASPLRLDVASRAHFPGSMLTTFRQTKNDDQLYIVPADLADLDEYQSHASVGRKSKAIPVVKIEDRTITNRILPYRLSLDELTEDLMVYDTKEKTRRMRTRAMRGRFQFLRHEMRRQKIAAYDSASKEYWRLKEELGELDDDVFKKPGSGTSWEDANWLPDITDRVADIMRQRLLIAIHEFANVQKSLPANRKSFFTTDWPAASILDSSLFGPFSMLKNAEHTEHWNDMGDIEAPGAVDGGSKRQGNHEDPRPPIAVKPSEINDSPLSSTIPNNPEVWLPGSFALHIGPPSTALKALPFSEQIVTASSKERTDTPLQQHNKFIPPMLSVDDLHLPVFNVQAMLGEKLSETLYKVLSTQPMLLPDGAQEYAHSELDYVILIKSNAKASFYVSQELWQLWRYLGGCDCLFAAVSQHQPAGQVEVSATNDPHRPEIEYAGLSEAALQHLHELLGLASPDQNDSPLHSAYEAQKSGK